jgi:hypothetical protein
MTSIKRTIHVVKDEPREVFVCDGCGKEWVSPEGWLRLPPEGWLRLTQNGTELHAAVRLLGDFCDWRCVLRFLHLHDAAEGARLEPALGDS